MRSQSMRHQYSEVDWKTDREGVLRDWEQRSKRAHHYTQLGRAIGDGADHARSMMIVPNIAHSILRECVSDILQKQRIGNKYCDHPYKTPPGLTNGASLL
jgi:hypothetical protein